MKHLRNILLLLAIACLLPGCEKEEPVVSVAPVQTVEVAETVDYTLPNKSEVKADTQPLLYDFVFGCLDWHVPINRIDIDSDLYLMRNVNLPGTVYTDWYPIQAGFTVPPLGSEIETVELTQRQLDVFDTLVASFPEGYVLREGDWELIICAGDAARTLKQYDFNFRGKYKYTEARVPPFIVMGTGWPTEWLRREPYCTALKEAGINIDDAWFDLFNYRAEYPLLQDDGTVTIEGYSVICTGVREFALCDGTGSVSYGMTWDNVRGTCNALECNLGDFYRHGSWEPEIKE